MSSGPGDDRDPGGDVDLGETDSADDLGAAAIATGDISDYIETRRLQQIFTARERVIDRFGKAQELRLAGEIQEAGKNVVLFESTRDYISELAPLLREYTTKTADRFYYHDAKLGTVVLETQANLQFEGLQSFLQAEPVYVETIKKMVDYPQGPPQLLEKHENHYMPKQVSWRAFDLANEFCHAVNIDVPLEIGGNEAQFQYDDLLE